MTKALSVYTSCNAPSAVNNIPWERFAVQLCQRGDSDCVEPILLTEYQPARWGQFVQIFQEEHQLQQFRYACKKAVLENPGLGFENWVMAANIYMRLYQR